MKAIVFSSVLFFLLYSRYVIPQEITIGDSTVVTDIKNKTSWIYENKDKTHFILTREKFYDNQISGTEITVYSLNDTVNRIICKSFTSDGLLSAEYYFHSGKVIFIYHAFEFFEESKNKSEWKNFKGMPSNESRYYITEGDVKFQRHRGIIENQIVNLPKSAMNESEKINIFVINHSLK